MRHNSKECKCSHGITSFKSVRFEINGSRIEMECNICNGIVGWWDEPVSTKKLTPFKREWTEEERLDMH